MEHANYTTHTYFILIVFSDDPWVRAFLFVLFQTIYIVAIVGNLLLILLRRIDHRLQTPMYFFLSHLSFIDLCFTSTIVTKVLANLATGSATISFLGCAAQMYFSLALGATECLLLAIMAYDRHMAICRPLHYHVLMNMRVCFLLAAICWASGLVNSFLHTVFAFLLPYCKSREISHFFCELIPLLRLACADTSTHEMWIFVSTVIIVICAFLLTFFSYIHIISTVLKIRSSKGRSKAFSTCSSHLLVIFIFYGTITSVYMQKVSTYNPERSKVIAVLYTMVIPMCNPLIYSVRNKEVKLAMMNTTEKLCSYFKIL